MSMEDPFFVVKGEVQKAVNTAQGLHQRWSELLQDPSSASKEEVDWTTNELRNSLRSIEWDLEDLDETINILTVIVESNPRKFNLDAVELTKRKAFITSTRQIVKDMKDQMSCPMAQAMSERKNRQGLMGDSVSQGSAWQAGGDKYSRLDRELQTANSQFIEEQQMLDDFSHEMDNTHSRLDNVMKKLAKVSHMTSDRRQWCAIGVLLAILFVVLILFFVL
ncbi:hypothetical protein JZ751_024713 [Albula glossodonta]|uniref:t-SNARE coiled-coil homology domain-containing protein n=1 Tax=Albula glossodonta TaxID=121402 RepID=A0A8T2PE48_9TELE|nr:hypothetical protein JZ751_024713 [Albula glossodonta]